MFVSQALEEGDYRASAPHHVAIANHGEFRIVRPPDVVGCYEEFIASELGGPIEIRGGASLIGR